VKEDVTGFLGISMEDQPSGSIQLMQKGLDRIFTVLILVIRQSYNKTPAQYGTLFLPWKMVMNV